MNFFSYLNYHAYIKSLTYEFLISLCCLPYKRFSGPLKNNFILPFSIIPTERRWYFELGIYTISFIFHLTASPSIMTVTVTSPIPTVQILYIFPLRFWTASLPKLSRKGIFHTSCAIRLLIKCTNSPQMIWFLPPLSGLWEKLLTIRFIFSSQNYAIAGNQSIFFLFWTHIGMFLPENVSTWPTASQ